MKELWPAVLGRERFVRTKEAKTGQKSRKIFPFYWILSLLIGTRAVRTHKRSKTSFFSLLLDFVAPYWLSVLHVN
jgi:hypothetical protein